MESSLGSIGYAFRSIIWPRRKLVLLGLLLILINRTAGLVLPGASKFLIDNAIAKANTDLLYLLLVAVALAVTLQAATSFLLTRLLSVEAQHLISKLRSRVQQHVIHLPVRYFETTRSGELVSRIMNDVEGVRNLVGTGLVQMVGGAFTACVALGLLISIDTVMTLLVVVPLMLFGIVSLKAFSYIRPVFRERSRIQAEVTGRLTESIAGIRVIKGFNAERFEMEVFEEGVERLFQNVRRSLTATSLLTSSATFLLGMAAVGIMGYGGLQILAGNLTVGDFVAFSLYLGFLIAPVVQISNIGSQITEAFAGLDRTQELLSVGREQDDAGRNIVLGEIEGEIRFEDVHFAYQPNRDVLHGVSFEVPPGTVCALVGSSGSGKSTIAGLAGSFLTADRGVVRIDGHDLARIRLGSYRSRLGVVLQDDFLFDGTIRSNLLLGRPDASPAQLQAAIRAAYVEEFVERMEKGLETVIGERGVKLSGGQRQRLAIARALLADPRILIFDEATSNLDAESEMYIQRSLKQLMQGRTTLVIAHRLSTIRQAHQILVIEQGRIVERGVHEQLIKQKGRYFDLFTYQARI